MIYRWDCYFFSPTGSKLKEGRTVSIPVFLVVFLITHRDLVFPLSEGKVMFQCPILDFHIVGLPGEVCTC